MELKHHVKEIIEYIESKHDYLELSKEMFDVLEGDIHSKLVKALRTQIISDSAFKSAVQRIPPINIMKRITTKLTQVYSSEPVRTALIDGEESEQAQEVVDYYVRKFDINTKFNDVDYFGNSIRYSAVEPYVSTKGIAGLRVLPSHQFLVWSNDKIEPNIPTVFIKLMGTIQKLGVDKQVYWLYSDEEILVIDSDGDVMEENENTYGIVSQSYLNDSSYLLMPNHEVDLLKMSILLPLLFTDLNDAVRYMAYSIIYTVDADSSNFERNPNVIVDLKSDDVNKAPSVGTLEPKVDIPNVLELIKTQMSDWLESKGLKPSGGNTNANASGVSLMIQEIDTTQRIKERMVKMAAFEEDFWERMIPIHNTWIKNGTVDNLPTLPENMRVTVEYELPKLIEGEGDRIDRAVIAKKEMLATTADALQIWKPKMTDEEAEAKAAELDKSMEVIVNGEQELDKDIDQNS